MREMLDLFRPRVSLAVAGGAMFGAFYYGPPHDGMGLVSAFGAGVLCAGCSALNQVQERRRDRLMLRTRNRPVASGHVSPRTGLLLSLLLFQVGLVLFFVAGGWTLLGLGVSVPIIYNGLYTPLKPKTPMALLVGAVSGALPPLTGWVGAGGSLVDPTILGVTMIFYLWQVPHFWLLHEKHREDYERAGFATLHSRLSEGMYRPMLALWVAAYFLGLGCLVAMAGMAAWNWLVPPVIVLGGGWALMSVLGNHRQRAATAVYASLPFTLAALLIQSY
ncbi:putative Protoheme IX farnesyltransferase [Pseudodesulfovibrio piezophilus C1TLV30]|uniref:Protoheme IX farnesyltransferase n=2 Tax=Pseudodesulfovibrio TaxID=2035811 RepID=M1WQR5_PSEP2|nr:putative Protoheme IX farnesyltransferase [Pseudodesulfovibrio piezophilus C1TLV30]